MARIPFATWAIHEPALKWRRAGFFHGLCEKCLMTHRSVYLCICLWLWLWLWLRLLDICANVSIISAKIRWHSVVANHHVDVFKLELPNSSALGVSKNQLLPTNSRQNSWFVREPMVWGFLILRHPCLTLWWYICWASQALHLEY